MNINPHRLKNSVLAAFVIALTGPSLCLSQTGASTGVVGFQTVSLPPNTVTAVGINFLNPNILVAPVAAVSSNGFTLSSVTNVASFLTAGTPYYVEVRSGTNEGARLDVDVAGSIASVSNVIIDSTSTRNTDSLSAIASSLTNSSIALRKHITLSDITPSIVNLNSGPSGTGDEVLLFNPSTASWVTYLRRTSTTWRDQYNAVVDPVVAPGEGILIRKRAASGSISHSGNVRANNFYLNTKSGYQFLTFGFPLDNSFSSLGAFGGGWKFGASGTGDEALLLKNDGSGYEIYLYRTSSSWRDQFNVTVNTNSILSGSSATLFKKANAENLVLNKPAGL